MKLTIKTLDQKTFHVDFDESKTVWDLKSHLGEMSEVGVKPELQQLIYAGRVLENELCLKAYSIDERKFLVIMAKKQTSEKTTESQAKVEARESSVKTDNKAATKSADKPGPSLKPNSSVAKEKTPAETKKSTVNTERNVQPVIQPILQPILQPVINSSVTPTTATNEALVHNIMNMGYAEHDVRRALQASFNNPDRAIEYLIEGIPDFPEMLATPSEINTLPTDDNPLAFLRNDPRFAQMRRIIQQRPEMLSTVLAKIGESNPALLTLIREHQEEFVRMLNNSDTDELYDMEDDDVIEVVLTEEERLAVERLVSLGFPRDIVLQAYIACEKNEEQTADFLCRHMEDN